MKQTICNDLHKMICSFRFWAAIGIIIIATLINLMTVLRFGNTQKSIGALSVFILGNIQSNPIMSFVAPFIPALAFGPVVLNEPQLGKISFKKYIGGHAVSSIIAGFSVFLLPLLIILIGCFIYSPTGNVGNYSPLGLFKDTYYSSIILYVVLFFIHSSLFGAIFGLFDMGIAVTTNNKAMAMVLPGIIYNCTPLIAAIIGKTIISSLSEIIPYFTYDFGGVDLPMWKSLSDFGTYLLLSVILITFGYFKLKKRPQYLLKGRVRENENQ